MKKIIQIITAATLCLFLTASPKVVRAQDASNPDTAASPDSSDWGLLGLIGLVGLLGLKKRPTED